MPELPAGNGMGWFSTTEVTAQARNLAADYARLRSGGIATGTAPDRLKRRHDKVTADAVAYVRSLGLNLYKKGRFFQALRAGLLEHSVPEAEAEDFVRGVIIGPLASVKGAGPAGRRD
jgi:hypothetical protein